MVCEYKVLTEVHCFNSSNEKKKRYCNVMVPGEVVLPYNGVKISVGRSIALGELKTRYNYIRNQGYLHLN